jgi:hypothetical protein
MQGVCKTQENHMRSFLIDVIRLKKFRFLKSAQRLWSYHKRNFVGVQKVEIFLKKMRNDLLCAKEIEKMGVRFFPHETLK